MLDTLKIDLKPAEVIRAIKKEVHINSFTTRRQRDNSTFSCRQRYFPNTAKEGNQGYRTFS